jgi:hypothetical protein
METLPGLVCVYTRSRRERCLQPLADYGYCAAKDLHYDSGKWGLRLSRSASTRIMNASSSSSEWKHATFPEPTCSTCPSQANEVPVAWARTAPQTPDWLGVSVGAGT